VHVFDIPTLLVVIPALPLAGAGITAVLGKHVLGRRSHIPVVTALALAMLLSLALVVRVQHEAAAQMDAAAAAHASRPLGYEQIVHLWTWAGVADANPQRVPGDPVRLGGPDPRHDLLIDVTLRADPLTATMLAMVTFVSLLVAVYAIGYMHGDPGYWRFFSYIGLFVFSMTMLVSVSNFVLLYVFWEAVGLCSYLLIGFWFEKPAAAAAGKKAFLVTRLGDLGFILGVFLIWTTYGTLNFHDTMVAEGGPTSMGVLGQSRLQAALDAQRPGLAPIATGVAPAAAPFVGGPIATAICLLLMAGACGKSAQFPLHVWLPDAMEGPTPVSALIHAATMVTAGVYMVARCSPLFVASAEAPLVVAAIGGFTALLAALIALTQTDLKRILAYSTISQLGYMFLGLGVGTAVGVLSGMFHLLTHAFFKALLFLGAGSVMHAMGGVIDLTRFSGLRRRMPVTHWTFLFGCLALAGLFPFAGFWSKDAIFAAVHEAMGTGPAGTVYAVLYYSAIFTALLTAFYTFRAYFLTFHGPERIPHEAGHHAHESPPVMTWPLAILAVGALTLGAVFELTGGLSRFLQGTPSLTYLAQRSAEPAEAAGAHLHIMLVSTLVAVAGIGLAAVLYLGSQGMLNALTRVMQGLGLYGLSAGKFFFDPLYNVFFVWPLRGVAWAAAKFDQLVVDGLVDLVGRAPKALAALLRPLQGGMLQFYALAMLLGLLVLMWAMWI